jgi:AcrR family transcriptional regulator
MFRASCIDLYPIEWVPVQVFLRYNELHKFLRGHGRLGLGMALGIGHYETDQNYELKEHVLDALDTLCRVSAFDDIAINDLCNSAHISRSTFYRLFENKYNVFSWYLETIIGEWGNGIGTLLTWEEAMHIPARGVLGHKDAAHGVLSSSYCHRAIDDMAASIQRALTACCKAKGVAKDDELAFQIEGCGWFHAHAIASWDASGYALKSDVFASYLEHAIPSKLYNALALD